MRNMELINSALDALKVANVIIGIDDVIAFYAFILHDYDDVPKSDCYAYLSEYCQALQEKVEAIFPD